MRSLGPATARAVRHSRKALDIREYCRRHVPSLSPGAVELPMHHVSVRVPWHDTDWTGRVCASPRTNQSCAVLNRIKKEKDPVAEAEIAGQAFGDVDAQLPPCVLERVGFMRPKFMTVQRKHAYGGNDAYAHFAETTQRMAPYSLEVIPFRWMRLDGYERASKPWGITVDLGLEQLGDRLTAPRTAIGDRDGPPVQVGLGLAERGDRSGAPPRARHVLDRLLDDALALRPPRRADPDLDAVMLGGLRELRRDPVSAGMHDGRHPIGPPRPRGAAQAAQHAVDRVDQVRERLSLIHI